MMTDCYDAHWFRRAVALAKWIVLPPLPLLIVTACAESDETNEPQIEAGAAIPSSDAGGAALDAESEADPAAVPCAVGALCSVPTPLALGSIVAIRGRSKDDVWASGSRGLLMHWDGQQWTDLHSGMNETLSSLFLTPDETWVVAGFTVLRRRIDPESVRRASTKFAVLADVAVLPNGDVYLISDPYLEIFPAVRPLAKIDFATGQVTYPPNPVHPLTKQAQSLRTRASCLVPDKALWLVGERGAVARYPVSPVGDGGISPPSDAGDAGASLLGQGVVVPLVSHVDLTAAWGYGEHVWTAGGDGTILHFDGAKWHAEDTGTTSPLNAIFGLAPNDIWAAGSKGTLLHFDGNAWSRVGVGAYDGDLRAIWGSAPDDVWIGGEGVMLHWGALP